MCLCLSSSPDLQILSHPNPVPGMSERVNEHVQGGVDEHVHGRDRNDLPTGWCDLFAHFWYCRVLNCEQARGSSWPQRQHWCRRPCPWRWTHPWRPWHIHRERPWEDGCGRKGGRSLKSWYTLKIRCLHGLIPMTGIWTTTLMGLKWWMTQSQATTCFTRFVSSKQIIA